MVGALGLYADQAYLSLLYLSLRRPIFACLLQLAWHFVGVSGVLIGGAALSGFTRRLFLQLLLEDEKLLVACCSSCNMYEGSSNALTTVVQHPRCGAGHKYRALSVSLQTTCAEFLAKLGGSFSGTFIHC